MIYYIIAIFFILFVVHIFIKGVDEGGWKMGFFAIFLELIFPFAAMGYFAFIALVYLGIFAGIIYGGFLLFSSF